MVWGCSPVYPGGGSGSTPAYSIEEGFVTSRANLPPALARRRTSPFGSLKKGYVYDDRLRRFINVETGRFVKPVTALRKPPRQRTIRYKVGTRSITFMPGEPDKRLHADTTLDLIRATIRKEGRRRIFVIRGIGGTSKYRTHAWSSLPMEGREILGMDDDELRDFLWGMTDAGPFEIDIYSRRE